MTFLWSLAAFQGSPSADSLILKPPPCDLARHGLRILRRPGSLHRPWHSSYAVFLHPTLESHSFRNIINLLSAYKDRLIAEINFEALVFINFAK